MARWPRLIELEVREFHGFKGNYPRFARRSRIPPAILSVDSQARAEALRSYQLVEVPIQPEHEIFPPSSKDCCYFNPDIDVVYIPILRPGSDGGQRPVWHDALRQVWHDDVNRRSPTTTTLEKDETFSIDALLKKAFNGKVVKRIAIDSGKARFDFVHMWLGYHVFPLGNVLSSVVMSISLLGEPSPIPEELLFVKHSSAVCSDPSQQVTFVDTRQFSLEGIEDRDGDEQRFLEGMKRNGCKPYYQDVSLRPIKLRPCCEYLRQKDTFTVWDCSEHEVSPLLTKLQKSFGQRLKVKVNVTTPRKTTKIALELEGRRKTVEDAKLIIMRELIAVKEKGLSLSS